MRIVYCIHTQTLIHNVLNVHIFGSFRCLARESIHAQSYTHIVHFIWYLLLFLFYNSLLWHFKCTRHNMTCLCGVMFKFRSGSSAYFILCRFGHDHVCSLAQMATTDRHPTAITSLE